MADKKNLNDVDYKHVLKNLELIKAEAEAVDCENYELAAKIRDKIIELNKKNNDGNRL
jgi:protein-arginine kinase activator protein McsA